MSDDDKDKIVSLAAAKAERTYSVEDIMAEALKSIKDDPDFKPTKAIVVMLDDRNGAYKWRWQKNLSNPEAIAVLTLAREAIMLPMMGEISFQKLPPKKPES